MTHTIKRNKTLGIDEVFSPSGECVGQIHKFGSFWYPNDHTRPGGHLIGGKRLNTLREARAIALEYFTSRNELTQECEAMHALADAMVRRFIEESAA